MNKKNNVYRSNVDLYQYKLLYKMPISLKELALDTDYTYLRVHQLCQVFVKQGLIENEEHHKYQYKLTSRGETVLKLLEGVYSELEKNKIKI